MIKRILVGLGGTPFTPGAIKQAVELAVRHEAELTGVTLVNVAQFVGSQDAAPESGIHFHSRLTELTDVERRIEGSIADFHAACDAAGVTVRRVVREDGEPFGRLIDEARYHDLIVFGLKKVLKYQFNSGSPQSLLVRFASSGVRPMLAVAERHRSVSRVVLAYNGSMESANAMKRFVEMRLFSKPTMKVLIIHNATNGLASSSKAMLAAAAEYCRAHGYEVETESVHGSAKDDLLRASAAWEADLIVMGVSTRRVFLKQLLGDTSLDVIQRAEIPLFVC